MILIVANSRDFGTDTVIERLRERGETYVRLDLDLLSQDEVFLDPLGPTLLHHLAGGQVTKISEPRTVLFRAPTHLRESSGHRYSPDELLRRHQWAAFCRSLVVFARARWINHPAATYLAEIKPYQLAVAASCGFAVPETVIANALPDRFQEADLIATKALDTFLVRKDDQDHFFYTTALSPSECTPDVCQEMPVIFQSLVRPKADLRVTVVGERCFVAETDGEIEGDWRRQKERVRFRPSESETEIADRCREIVKRLQLVYGAVDLARSDGRLWFLEVNPTGEWAWLDATFEGEIADAIAAELASVE